ncbi:MAG: peptidylprolyl isomerase [Alphaproteobacteria bacterium]|nr:MAG: peptidylprolyl isomerase [Alphaproteobacteria bacterium]
MSEPHEGFPILVIELDGGEVRIRLRPDLAPQHTARLIELARSGAYDGVVFHRVIEGFMAQTGDVAHGSTTLGYRPWRVGTGGSQLPDLPAEFTDTPFRRGTVGMARAADPDSANSQFFIMFADAPHLDGNYTVVGEVIEGMELIDALPRGEPPMDPGVMRRVRVEGAPEAADG